MKTTKFLLVSLLVLVLGGGLLYGGRRLAAYDMARSLCDQPTRAEVDQRVYLEWLNGLYQKDPALHRAYMGEITRRAQGAGPGTLAGDRYDRMCREAWEKVSREAAQR